MESVLVVVLQEWILIHCQTLMKSHWISSWNSMASFGTMPGPKQTYAKI